MSGTKFKLFAHAAAVALSVGAFAHSAHADADVGPSATSSDKIEEVTVTATKRATSLQSTPIAVSAYSQSTLDRDHVSDITDLTKFAPSLEFDTHGDQGAVTITLRGIGNDSAYTELDSPEVGLYVDGIYSARAQGATTMLYDMDRVEVLRGPQGTLFGRNTTVGAVNFITARPTLDEFYGSAEIGAGDYNAIESKVMANIPITNKFGLRFAGALSQHDGYIDHQSPPVIPGVSQASFVTGGPKYDSEDKKSFRVSALLEPTDSISWNLSYEYFKDTGIPNLGLPETPARGQAFWSSLYQMQPYMDRDSQSIRSHFDWSITDYVGLSYVAGFTTMRGSEDYETDLGLNLPTAITSATGPTLGDPTGNYAHNNTPWSKFNSYSNEVQVHSQGNNKIDWMVGGYQEKEINAIRFDVDAFNGYNGPGNTYAWSGSFIQPHRTQGDRALFGQVTYHVTDDLRVTGGWRSSWDNEEDNGGRNVTFNGCPAPYTWSGCGTSPQNLSLAQLIASGQYAVADNDASIHTEKNTSLIRLEYDLTPHDLVYVSRGTGYHPGRIADLGFSDNPETLTNYEIGFKDSFFDGKMTLNSAAYYEDFVGYQLTQVIATYNSLGQQLTSSSHQVNTKGATGYGLEEELAWKATHEDTLTLGVSLQHATLKGWTSCDSNIYIDCGNATQAPGEVRDYKGSTLVHTPTLSGTLTYDHSFTLGNGGTVVPRVSMHFETMSYLNLYNDRGTFGGQQDPFIQKAYTRTELGVVYNAPDKRYSVEAFVRNLEDNHIKTEADTTTIGSGLTRQLIPTGLYEAPRTVGARVSAKF
jgi:iron complex outermembrane receptor protein